MWCKNAAWGGHKGTASCDNGMAVLGSRMQILPKPSRGRRSVYSRGADTLKRVDSTIEAGPIDKDSLATMGGHWRQLGPGWGPRPAAEMLPSQTKSGGFACRL